MIQPTLTPAAELLNSNTNRLRRLRTRAAAFEYTSRIVRGALPDSLAPFCAGALIRKTTLIVFVDSPAWGARIRFQQTAILKAVRAAPVALSPQRIRIKILPPEQRARRAPPAPARRELSATARRSLHAAANSIADEKLANALRRLAQR